MQSYPTPSTAALDKTLASFLAQFPQLTPAEAEAIEQQLHTRICPKGTVLLRAGEVSRECFFVLRGCVRQYHLTDGTEKTVQFYTEGQAAVVFASYTQQTVSDCWLVCTEDSLLIAGDSASENTMYAQFPKLAQITRTMMEQDFGRMQTEFAAFVASTPEERYLSLLNTRPTLLQRVPQHQLASYIGVTPESLSRIRRRVSHK